MAWPFPRVLCKNCSDFWNLRDDYKTNGMIAFFAMTSSSGRKINLTNGKKCYPKNNPIESCKSWKNRYCQNTLGMKNFSTLTATSTTVKYKLMAWNDATGTKIGHIFLKIKFFLYVSGGKIHLKIVNVWAKKALSGFLKFLAKILLIFLHMLYNWLISTKWSKF